jgi:hypothetical protein
MNGIKLINFVLRFVVGISTPLPRTGILRSKISRTYCSAARRHNENGATGAFGTHNSILQFRKECKIIGLLYCELHRALQIYLGRRCEVRTYRPSQNIPSLET